MNSARHWLLLTGAKTATQMQQQQQVAGPASKVAISPRARSSGRRRRSPFAMEIENMISSSELFKSLNFNYSQESTKGRS